MKSISPGYFSKQLAAIFLESYSQVFFINHLWFFITVIVINIILVDVLHDVTQKDRSCTTKITYINLCCFGQMFHKSSFKCL